MVKLQWTAELERRRKCGSPESHPIPHPDDIIIDMRTGKVRTEGPLDKREKQMLDRQIGRRDDAAAQVGRFADRFRQAATSQQRRQWREKWHFEQRLFDILNDGVPTRYRAKLEDRSLANGASKEGEALKEFQRMLGK